MFLLSFALISTGNMWSSLLLLLFAMIRSVVKSFKVPGVEVVASRMSND